MLDSSVWISVGSESSAPVRQHSWDESQRTDRSGSPILEPSSETRLVKDSLDALQGVGAAVTRLREQAGAFKLQAADKTAHNISTLWSLASSTNALAKLLTEIAAAGSYRCQLDQFVQFFLSSQHVGAVKPQEDGGSTRSRRRRRKQEAEKEDDKKVSPGLLNQAFAAGLRTILQGHSASLDALLGSLSRRRCDSEPVSDRYGGALFGFGHGFVSLLELYLHTAELRMQLQALAHVCLLDNSDGSEASCTGRLKNFPQGAELLTHLYNLLLEPEPLHLELLRFLFSRTLDPYMLFIRTCIYCATLEDPHGEFILEKRCPEDGSGQGTLKVRSGVNTPVFLVPACTQILRAAQQLEVLLRLPETRDFALAFSSRVHSRKLTTVDDTPDSDLEEKFDKAKSDEKPEDTGWLEPEATPEAEEDFKAESDEAIVQREDGTNTSVSSHASFVSTKTLWQLSEERKTDEGLDLFLSGYNKSATWLDVGLPRNPFLSGDTRVYGYIYTLFLDNDDSWDIRSSIFNEDCLLKQLLPELAQVGLLTLPRSIKNKEDVDLVSVLLNTGNLPAVTRRVPDPENDNASEPVLETDSCDQGNVKSKAPVQGGGRWESSLKLAQKTSSEESYHDELEMSDTPVSVVVETTIVGEIRKQYRLVSDFTVKVLQESLHLREHYMALRRYYFMEVGDWADNFITSLCSHKWGRSGCRHHLVEAQGMLEAALQKSSCDGDPYTDRVQVRLCQTPVSEFVNLNSLEAFDFIDLEYNIEWPLDMILTSESFQLYKQVFRLLLRVKHAVFALGEISKTLQAMERPSRKFSFQNPDQKNRFRALQLFRHQIGHFVTAFQSHIQSQLLHVIWSDFLHAIQHEIKDMQDLEIVHLKYLNNAVQRCFLLAEQEAVKVCMVNIMQCLLNFRSILRHLGEEQEGYCSDVLYSKVLELRTYFGENIRLLRRYHLRPEVHSHLSEFWTSLDYNGYFVSTC